MLPHAFFRVDGGLTHGVCFVPYCGHVDAWRATKENKKTRLCTFWLLLTRLAFTDRLYHWILVVSPYTGTASVYASLGSESHSVDVTLQMWNAIAGHLCVETQPARIRRQGGLESAYYLDPSSLVRLFS